MEAVRPFRESTAWVPRIALAAALAVFLLGFILGLDPGGGSRSDFYRYHLPAILAFRHGNFLDVLRDYSSATTPLFHMLASWNPLLGRDTAFRASNVCFSLLVTWLYVALLRRRFSDVPGARTASLLMGAALLLSPYFESTTYWPITDTLPIFFLLAAAALMPDAARPAGKRRIALLALFSAAAFYTRQNYLFLPVYTGILLFREQRNARAWTVLCFALVSLPGLYLARLWHGLTPPSFQEHHQGFSWSIMLYPLTLIAFYALPLLASRPLPPALRSRGSWVAASGGAVLFLALLHRWSFAAHPLGGGIAVKLFAKAGPPGVYLFLGFAYLGLLMVGGLLGKGSWKTRLLVVLVLLPTFMLKVVYQRYYDPLLLILFFLFLDRSIARPLVSVMSGWAVLGFAAALLAGAGLFHGRDSGIYPIYSARHPWEGIPLLRLHSPSAAPSERGMQ